MWPHPTSTKYKVKSDSKKIALYLWEGTSRVCKIHGRILLASE